MNGSVDVERRVVHPCHATGCSVEVPPRMFMCYRHWYALPKPFRDAVWRAYRPGQEVDKRPSSDYLDAANNAIKWLEQRG